MRLFLALIATALVHHANAESVLERVTSPAISYDYITDFTVPVGSGTGDVTAAVWAVDLNLPSTGGSTSGCEAADFIGFAVNSIALVQRGTCNYSVKVANA
jgi:hypothetical protein